MRKINNYSSFLKKNVLRYYSFDWDDNILHMDTPIHMDKFENSQWIKLSVKPSEFALVRNNENYRCRNNNPNEAFEEFRDIGPRGDKAFIQDVQKALNDNAYGPSWGRFLKCLTEGALFSIVTARGHEYSTIRKGVEYIINNILTNEEKETMYNNCLKFSKIFDNKEVAINTSIKFTENELIERYLDCCKYYGVGAPMSKSFKEEFNCDDDIKIEDAKKIAIGKFLEICSDYSEKIKVDATVGFSDDDKKNVQHVKDYFAYKSTIYERMKLNVYDTSDKTKSFKTRFENGVLEDMGQTINNLENSILRFNNFTSMANTLQFSTNDFSQPNYTNLQKAKVANMITKPKKKKFKKKFKKKKKSNVNKEKKEETE